MTRWTHSKPGVRGALDEAHAAGLTVEPTATRGHTWGYIDCTDPDCADPQRRIYVSSTPKDQDNEASKIRRFIRRHQHKKEEPRP